MHTVYTWVWSIMPAWIISQLLGGLSGGGVTQERGESSSIINMLWWKKNLSESDYTIRYDIQL